MQCFLKQSKMWGKELVNNEKDYKTKCKPYFFFNKIIYTAKLNLNARIYSIVECSKEKVCFDKPTYVEHTVFRLKQVSYVEVSI